MSWEKSDTMKEFGKIMTDNGLLKVAESKNPHPEDAKTIKEKRVPSEKDIIEQAHPEAVYVAESKGDGALVENQNEQHKKLMEIINKMPTGMIVHRYANAINTLIKMAEACDEVEELDASDVLTNTASQLVALVDALPFEKALDK